MSPDKDVAYATNEPRQETSRHGFGRTAGLIGRLRAIVCAVGRRPVGPHIVQTASLTPLASVIRRPACRRGQLLPRQAGSPATIRREHLAGQLSSPAYRNPSGYPQRRPTPAAPAFDAGALGNG